MVAEVCSSSVAVAATWAACVRYCRQVLRIQLLVPSCHAACSSWHDLLCDAANPLAAAPPIHMDMVSPFRCACCSDGEVAWPENSACLFRWMRPGPAPSQASAADQPAFERKRLQLKPRSLPAPELPTPPEPKPEEPKAERQPQAAPAAPKPRSNPFGQARPREEVLKEKGVSESGSDKVDRWGTSWK